MGKGTIISGGTNGLYQIQINYNRDRYTELTALMDAQVTAYTAKVADLDTDIAAKEAEIAAESRLEALNKLILELDRLQTKREIFNLRKVSFATRKSYLQDTMPADETVSAWCADYTEDLSGVVGTIEVPGYEIGSDGIQIKPGFTSAAWSESDDKQLLPEVIMSAYQSFFNRAVLPAVEKWKPRYRYGTITSTNGVTADITLDAALSSQQDLDINQATTLTGVPFDYMDCDGSIFQIDDIVLIEFLAQDWDDPVIIGFKEDPRPCECRYIELTAGNLTIDDQYDKSDTVWNYNYPNEIDPDHSTTHYIVKPTAPDFLAAQVDTGGGTDITFTCSDIPTKNNGEVVTLNIVWTKNGQSTIALPDLNYNRDYTIDYQDVGGDKVVIEQGYDLYDNTGTWVYTPSVNYVAPSDPALPGGSVEISNEFDFTRNKIAWWVNNLSVKQAVIDTISLGYRYVLFEITSLDLPATASLTFGISVTGTYIQGGNTISANGKYYMTIPAGITSITAIAFSISLYNMSEEIYNDTHGYLVKDLRFCSVLPGDGEIDISNWV